jgi:hypothetical protein
VPPRTPMMVRTDERFGGGPGNPFARFTAELRKAFAEEATPDDLRKVARALLDKAQGGDVAAARVVLGYTLGKPMEGVDPDRHDEMECQQWCNETVNREQANAVIRGMGANMFCQFLRGVVPILSQMNWQILADGLALPPDTEEEEAEGAQEPVQSPAKGEEPRRNPGASQEKAKETAADVGQASREAARQARDLLGEGQSLPIRPIADDKRPTDNGRAANPGKAGRDRESGPGQGETPPPR